MNTEKMDVDVPEHNALPVESNGATPPDASGTQHAKDEDKAQPPVQPRRPSRLKDVSPRTLEDFKNSRELVWTMLGAIEAHRALYEKAGTLHGDINTNTIIILDWPAGSEQDGQQRRPPTEGALVDFDVPYSREAWRKAGERWPPKHENSSRYRRGHFGGFWFGH